MFPTDGGFKMWNTRFAGKEAFTSKNGKGYRSGGIFYLIFDAHLVAWAIATGAWPTLHIDHINGDKADNRFANLREVTNAENLKNKSLYANNTSGQVGVHREGGRWSARISVRGVYRRIGNFASFEEACQARKNAEAALGYHANHGRPK